MPRHVLTTREQRIVTEAASRTPGLEAQHPWRLVFVGDRLEVRSDSSIMGPLSVDPQRRVRAISCGSATYAACLAIRATGHEAWIQVQPSPYDAELAAVVHVGVERQAALSDLELYQVNHLRSLDPGPFRDWRLPFSLIIRLEEAAEVEGGQFRVLTSSELERIWEDRAEREEVPKRAGEVGASIPRQVRRRPTTGDLTETRIWLPTLAILSTPGNSPKDWVRAGMAVERVCLTALRYGVFGVIDAEAAANLRQRWPAGSLMTIDHPQILLRLGYPRHQVIKDRGGISRSDLAHHGESDGMSVTGRSAQ